MSKFNYSGLSFNVETSADVTMGAPWAEYDGHGVVSEWVKRDKKPTERVLVSERGMTRYYDVQASTAQARAEAWGIPNADLQQLEARAGRPLTVGEIAAAAVAADFEYLRGYAAGEWGFDVVTVSYAGYSETMTGVENSSQEYIDGVCAQLADQIMRQIREEVKNLHNNLKMARTQFSTIAGEIRAAKFSPAICQVLREKLQNLRTSRRINHARLQELTA